MTDMEMAVQLVGNLDSHITALRSLYRDLNARYEAQEEDGRLRACWPQACSSRQTGSRRGSPASGSSSSTRQALGQPAGGFLHVRRGRHRSLSTMPGARASPRERVRVGGGAGAFAYLSSRVLASWVCGMDALSPRAALAPMAWAALLPPGAVALPPFGPRHGSTRSRLSTWSLPTWAARGVGS